MIPHEFTPRKVNRKLREDGLVDTGVTAVDLFTRKYVGRRIFDPIVEHGVVGTVSRDEISNCAVSSTELEGRAVDKLAPFVVQLPRGYVLTETGLSTTKNFEIIEESAATPAHARQAMMAMASRELFVGHLPVRALLRGYATTTPPTLDTVAPLIPRYPNYYHWMVETVPKIRYLRAFENQTNVDVSLLLPAEAPEFVEETLDLLGWPKSDIVRAAEPMYEVRNLIVPSFPERTPADFEWLSGEILNAASARSAGRSRTNEGSEEFTNVYVSRETAIARRVVNEDAVMDVLSKYGFKRYLLENRSLAENARLFNQADVVVGPHGAGLTDILFAEECTLVELFGARLNKAYENLSETLDIEYEPIYCRAESADIEVDVEKLETTVASIVD